ncbi:MAG: hypothetical protein ACSHXB_16830 [Sulfitobacter sp.]
MTFSPKIYIAAVLAGTLLSACTGNNEGTAVRNGPQAVHPSPSPLAATGLYGDTTITPVTY